MVYHSQKICQTYFKIGQTYFKISQRYFLQGVEREFAVEILWC